MAAIAKQLGKDKLMKKIKDMPRPKAEIPKAPKKPVLPKVLRKPSVKGQKMPADVPVIKTKTVPTVEEMLMDMNPKGIRM